MKNDIDNTLEKFLEDSKDITANADDNGNVKKIILKQREGLIERVDCLYVTSDGRQLLREQY